MSIKLRNRFLALLCLLAFFALGLVFYVNWVVQKPFAIVLFLTDNLTVGTLTASRIYGNGADSRLRLESFPNLALLSTQAGDFAVSDSAAAVTAIATGQKVNNRSIAVDSSGRPLKTLLDFARERGRSVGLVSNASLTDIAPAAFYAHTNDPHDHGSLALQLVQNPGFDVVLGGGEADLLPEHKNGTRRDGRDLLLEMRQQGYDIVRNRAELENTPLWRAPKILGVFASGNLAFVDEIESAGPQPSLAEMVRAAIRLLQFNRKGYLLVVDAGLTGKAAHQNEGERAMRELLSLDAAVAEALAYAGENSLVIVAGRQSIGGMRMNGYPFRNDKGLAVLGMNAQGFPAITWSTGPGSAQAAPSAEAPALPREPSAFAAPAAIGVAEDVIAVSSGPGAENLQGFKDNTDIFKTIEKNL